MRIWLIVDSMDIVGELSADLIVNDIAYESDSNI